MFTAKKRKGTTLNFEEAKNLIRSNKVPAFMFIQGNHKVFCALRKVTILLYGQLHDYPVMQLSLTIKNRKDRARWREIRKAYVQQWTVVD
jgi:hypothetical protein